MVTAPFGTSYYVEDFDSSQDWRKLNVKDMIVLQDPRARPYNESINMEGRSVSNRTVKWPVRGVKTRAANAAKEGATFTKTEVSPPNFAENVTQIITSDVVISGTSMAEEHYGTATLKDDQVDLIFYEHSADIEYNSIRNAKTSGGTNFARLMDGLVNWITTNATGQGGTTLTESLYVDMIELLHASVDAPQVICLTNTKLRRTIDGFSGEATSYHNKQIREVNNTILRYHSSFGDVDNLISRDLLNTSTAGEMVMYDPRQQMFGWLRETNMIVPAKVEDADRVVILSECTVDYGNEQAGALFSEMRVV